MPKPKTHMAGSAVMVYQVDAGRHVVATYDNPLCDWWGGVFPNMTIKSEEVTCKRCLRCMQEGS